MQQRHQDRTRYFKEQAYTTQQYVLPFIEDFLPLSGSLSVLEIGCGEGGNLLPFLEMGCTCVGIDLNAKRIAEAQDFYQDHRFKDHLKLIVRDIYQVTPAEIGRFDVIMMRDVIEHIHNQERFMGYVKQFLKPNGKFFLGFPPWYMPFGGHQQICKHRWLSKLPYFHLLPRPLYRRFLQLFGEPERIIEDLLEIQETGISIERFRRIVQKEGYIVHRELFYLINPNYEVKFKLQPREQFAILKAIPRLRNFVTTCCYYCLSL